MDIDFLPKPEAKFLMDFIRESKGQFVVPVFQREYKWSPYKMVDVFWNDIEKLIENSSEHHFMGLFMYEINSISTSDIEINLIDGQQRIATSFLLLKAISTKLTSTDREYFKTEFIFMRRSVVAKLKLKGLATDNECFIKIMSDKDLKQDDKKTNVYKVFDYFKEKITKYNFDGEHWELILNRIYVITIPLFQKHKSQEIFESLNSKGIVLTPVDLIRNYILMGLPHKNQKHLYDTYWCKIQENVKPNRIVDFVLNWLRCKKKTIIYEPHLYENFKLYLRENKIDKEDLLKELLEYSKFFKEIYYDSNLNYLSDFRKFRTSFYAASIVMELFKKREDKLINDEKFKEIILLFNTYLLRREICDLNYDLGQIFCSLFEREFNDEFYDFCIFKLVNENVNKPKRAMPTDDDVCKSLQHISAYKKPFTDVLFRNIEENKDGYKITKLINGLTIEHIMPQNPRDDSQYWKLFENNDGVINYNEFETYVNKIGNLTYLTRKENNDAKNNEWLEKYKFYTNKKLIINEPLANLIDWNKNSIDERTKFFVDKVVNIFPYMLARKIYGKHINVEAKIRGWSDKIYGVYNNYDRSLTIKKGTKIWDYSNDDENVWFNDFNQLVNEGIVQKSEDNNYYFTEDYKIIAKRSKGTAKSSSINFITNGNYSGEKKWKEKK